MSSSFIENDFLLGRLVYEQAFTPEECEKICQTQGPSFDVTALRYGEQNDITRWSIEHTDGNQWIINKLKAIIYQLNEMYYHFDLKAILSTHVAHYTQGATFDWHIDMSTGSGSTRKLAVIVFLSKPDDYQGGKLVFHSHLPDFEQKQGTAVIFPAYLSHKVETITQGHRFAMVSWAHGPAFR